jgi:predicted kinase
VRGKVAAFQLDEPEIPAAQREAARKLAQALFALAAHYADMLKRPALLLIGGLMGTGKSTLADRRSVLLDASFARRADRQAAARLAAAQGVRAIFIECVCPAEVALHRLAQRWAARVAGEMQASAEASQASGGRPDLYERQRARWEAFSAEHEPGLAHLRVETTGALAVSVEQALVALEVPRFACWL